MNDSKDAPRIVEIGKLKKSWLPEELSRRMSDYAHLNSSKKVRGVLPGLEHYFDKEIKDKK